jgi:hypothetical protein
MSLTAEILLTITLAIVYNIAYSLLELLLGVVTPSWMRTLCVVVYMYLTLDFIKSRIRNR